ncbi:hypothetical protein BH18ACT4_BH18ACT4_02460 [soil metagenome]
MLFAVQLLTNLYSTTVVTGAAHEAASMVATAPNPDDTTTMAQAEDHARQLLGAYGTGAQFTWDRSDPDVVALRVEVDNPRFLFDALDGALGFDTVDRTVRVRVEQRQ